MPDLLAFAELTAITDQWKQAGAPPGSLLEQIKPLVPGVENLRLYAVENRNLTHIAQTSSTVPHEANFAERTADSLFARIMDGETVAQSLDGLRAVLGLSSSGMLRYILEIEVEDQQGLDVAWWEAAAVHLAHILSMQPDMQKRVHDTPVYILDTMNKLATRLTTTRDEHTLLRYICEAMVEGIGIDHVAIHMFDAENDVVQIVSELPKARTVGLQLPADLPLYQKLQGQRSPYLVEDIAGDILLGDVLREKMAELNVQSALMIPLYDSRSEWIGMVALHTQGDKQIFTNEMIEIATTITAQASVSLQNVRMVRSTLRQAAQMEQIAGFSQSIQAVMDVPTLLEIGLINALQIIQADDMSIIMYDMEPGCLRQVAWCDANLDVHVVMHAGPVVEVNGTTAGWVWAQHELLQVDDFSQTEDLRYTFDDDIRSSISLPIYSRGALTGIVEVGSKQVANYSSTDVVVFQQLISQLAGAVENAEVYTQSQRMTRSKTLVNDISNQLAQQTEIESILQLTILELGRALGARHARIRLTPAVLSDGEEVAQ